MENYDYKKLKNGSIISFAKVNDSEKLRFADGLSLTGRKIGDPEPPCPLCEAGHKPKLVNYAVQMNYTILEQIARARLINEFNNSSLKSRINLFQDEITINVSPGEKEQVIELLKKLGFCMAR